MGTRLEGAAVDTLGVQTSVRSSAMVIHVKMGKAKRHKLSSIVDDLCPKSRAIFRKSGAIVGGFLRGEKRGYYNRAGKRRRNCLARRRGGGERERFLARLRNFSLTIRRTSYILGLWDEDMYLKGCEDGKAEGIGADGEGVGDFERAVAAGAQYGAAGE